MSVHGAEHLLRAGLAVACLACAKPPAAPEPSAVTSVGPNRPATCARGVKNDTQRSQETQALFLDLDKEQAFGESTVWWVRSWPGGERALARAKDGRWHWVLPVQEPRSGFEGVLLVSRDKKRGLVLGGARGSWLFSGDQAPCAIGRDIQLAAFHPDGRRLVVASDSSLAILDARSGSPITTRRVDDLEKAELKDLHWGSYAITARLRDHSSWGEEGHLSIDERLAPVVQGAQFTSASGNHLVFESETGNTRQGRVVESHTGREVGTYEAGEAAPRQLDVTPDGRFVFRWVERDRRGRRKPLRIIDLKRGRDWELPRKNSSFWRARQYGESERFPTSKDGRYLCQTDGEDSVFDLERGVATEEIRCTEQEGRAVFMRVALGENESFRGARRGSFVVNDKTGQAAFVIRRKADGKSRESVAIAIPATGEIITRIAINRDTGELERPLPEGFDARALHIPWRDEFGLAATAGADAPVQRPPRVVAPRPWEIRGAGLLYHDGDERGAWSLAHGRALPLDRRCTYRLAARGRGVVGICDRDRQRVVVQSFDDASARTWTGLPPVEAAAGDPHGLVAVASNQAGIAFLDSGPTPVFRQPAFKLSPGLDRVPFTCGDDGQCAGGVFEQLAWSPSGKQIATFDARSNTLLVLDRNLAPVMTKNLAVPVHSPLDFSSERVVGLAGGARWAIPSGSYIWSERPILRMRNGQAEYDSLAAIGAPSPGPIRLVPLSDKAVDLSYDPSTNTLAATWERAARIYDAATGTTLATLIPANDGTLLAFMPDAAVDLIGATSEAAAPSELICVNGRHQVLPRSDCPLDLGAALRRFGPKD
ncbi:MAG: hypothetical protein AAGA56_07500 [Myxococcota bacterium]